MNAANDVLLPITVSLLIFVTFRVVLLFVQILLNSCERTTATVKFCEYAIYLVIIVQVIKELML